MSGRIDILAAWWRGRSGRERGLLTVMALLFLAVGVWFGVVGPVMAWRADAAERRATAERRLDRLQIAERRVRPVADVDPAAVRASAEPAATAAGLTATFTAGDRGLEFTIASAATPALFGWLAQLEASGVTPAALTVTETSEGTLTAQGTLVQSAR